MFVILFSVEQHGITDAITYRGVHFLPEYLKVRFELRRLGYTKRKCLLCLVPRTVAVNRGNKRLLS
jgi:hypothetical protein